MSAGSIMPAYLVERGKLKIESYRIATIHFPLSTLNCYRAYFTIPARLCQGGGGGLFTILSKIA